MMRQPAVPPAALAAALACLLAGAGPAAAQQPELPSQENFHLYVLAGQSNMAGRGKVGDEDRRPIERVLMYDKQGRWRPAVAPLHFDKPIAGVGLGRSFAKALVDADPDIVVGLVPCAVGGSPIDSWAPGGYHASTKTHPWDDALKRIKAALPAGTLKGVLWHQGESDAKPELAANYEEKLHELVARFRRELNAPDVPFIAGQMGQFAERPWSEAKKRVDRAHRELPRHVAHTAFVSSDGLGHKGDQVHFDAKSYRELGRRYAAAYRQLTSAPDADDTGANEARPVAPFRRREINASATYSACAIFDVDNDGAADIFSGGFWYKGPGWKRRPVRDVQEIRGRFDDYSNLPLDVDGDGWTDVVSANYRSQSIFWVRNPGPAGGPWQVRPIDAPGAMETGRLVDVDQDGRLDVLPNGVKFAAWYELPRPAAAGQPPQWRRHELPVEVAGHGVGFGDINGDGRGDVVGPRGWLRAPEDRRRGRWLWHAEFQLHRDCSIPIVVRDVDDDGDSDLIWGRGHNVGLYWLEQVLGPDGERRWRQHAIDTSWSQPHSLLTADLDGDGVDELVAGKRFMGHEGRDPGEFDPLVIAAYQFDRQRRAWRRSLVNVGGGAGFGLDPAAGDVDGDGDVDLVGAGRSGLFLLENRRADGTAPAARANATAVSQYQDHTDLMKYRDEQGELAAVENRLQWGIRRLHILRGMEQAMGPLPECDRRVPVDVEIVAEEDAGSYVRRRISYQSEPGDRTPAYLLIPQPVESPAPAMLCLHQTTKIGKGEPAGLGGLPTLHYAHELAERGYVCIVPDYPSFGDYEYDFAGDRHRSGTMKAVWNNIRAVDVLESLPEVDRDAIGCIGHSLGGHNGLFTAPFDLRIRAVVTSCGFTAFHRYYGGDLQGWTSDRYMPAIREQYGNDPGRVPFDFHEVLAAIAPRPVFVCAPTGDSNFDVTGVKEVVAAARQVYALWDAEDQLATEYPETGHSFPDDIRRQAYRWLDESLK